MASDAPVAWNLPSWQQIPRSARIDSAAAIRGLQWDGSSYRPEIYGLLYTSPPVTLHDEIIDAEWHDVVEETRVARWNTVWADIGQAYNKKVHCIEG